jgi:formiminoglutamase
LRDTDWHVEALFDALLPDATRVRATFHRYVIDANRDPAGTSLYPGQMTTGLVPLTNFDAVPIWSSFSQPDAGEISRRLECFHLPYHAALRAEMARVRSRHGIAVLFDCHSIRSVIPAMFEGTLPDFNIGTDMGRSCAPEIEQAVHQRCAASGRTFVLNGRFRGGWSTRHYGQPQIGFHAIQLELAQSSYLAQEVPPFNLSAERAASLRPHLRQILQSVADQALRLIA